MTHPPARWFTELERQATAGLNLCDLVVEVEDGPGGYLWTGEL